MDKNCECLGKISKLWKQQTWLIQHSAHLPIPVAEGDGHHEPLQGVQQDIRVLVGSQEVAAPRLNPGRKNVSVQYQDEKEATCRK